MLPWLFLPDPKILFCFVFLFFFWKFSVSLNELLKTTVVFLKRLSFKNMVSILLLPIYIAVPGAFRIFWLFTTEVGHVGGRYPYPLISMSPQKKKKKKKNQEKKKCHVRVIQITITMPFWRLEYCHRTKLFLIFIKNCYFFDSDANLAMASFISDSILDEIIEQLSNVEKELVSSFTCNRTWNLKLDVMLSSNMAVGVRRLTWISRAVTRTMCAHDHHLLEPWMEKFMEKPYAQ